MKKYHFYLWLVALVGLMTSCSQDETDALQTANESNRVTLTASLPDDFAQIGTRALPSADGHQLRCILEVWTRDASPVLKYRKEETNLSGDNVVFDFKIEKGTYDCLFWADFINNPNAGHATIGGVDCSHFPDIYYTTNTDNGLKAISIIDSKYANGFNTDVRDAFFGHYELTKEAAAVTNPSIPALTRPFAKLTIKEKDATNYSYCSGLTATYQVPTTFNVLDGTVGNTMAEVTCSSKSTDSQTLFSDYIFTAASSTLSSIALTFTGITGKKLQPVTIPAGIPLKRNYKTNASGSLISEEPVPTDGVKLTVTMDATWTGTEIEHDIAKIWDGKYPASVEEAKAWMGTETSGGDDATAAINHVFTITAARQLAALHYLVCNTTRLGETNLQYRDATYKLATDIDLDEKPWTSIGTKSNGMSNEFQGVFDGQGHTVQGMNTTGDVSNSGFFARVNRNTAIIKHLNVKGKITPDATTDRASVSCGGIAGTIYNGAIIAFCSFEGTISAKHSTNQAIYAGGIVGQLGGSSSTGKIFSCYSVVTEMNGTTTGTVAKGGIAGYVASNYCTIKGCYWQELTGISNDSPYGAVKDNVTVTVADNGHFSNATGANAALNTMNGYVGTEYDYQWQAGTNGGYPVLVPKN